MITDIEYFNKRIIQVDDCWQWSAALTTKGYARFAKRRPDGKRILAHRFSYEYYIAEIPEGLTIDHLCQNKWCVNPWHLEPVPNSVNIARRYDRTVTKVRDWDNGTCTNGHNLAIVGHYKKVRKSNVSFECKECRRNQRMRYYNRTK